MNVEPAKNVIISGPKQADFNPSAFEEYRSVRKFPIISTALLIGAVGISMLFRWPSHFPGELHSKQNHDYVSNQQSVFETDHSHSRLVNNLDPYAPPAWAIPSAKKIAKEEE